MERLTQWFGSSRLGREAGMAPKYDGVYTEEELINVLLSNLAAYEDTGLDPDGIQALKVTLGRREGELLTDFDGIPLARMLEIAKAEKEGRLFIIPFYQWIPVEGGLYKCGKCHTERKADPARDHYCPNCGFSMHGAAEEDLGEEQYEN